MSQTCTGSNQSDWPCKDEHSITNLFCYSESLLYYWIGLKAQCQQWQWMNKKPYDHTSWYIDYEPTPQDGNCVYTQNDGWFDELCQDANNVEGFICEKSASKLLVMIKVREQSQNNILCRNTLLSIEWR